MLKQALSRIGKIMGLDFVSLKAKNYLKEVFPVVLSLLILRFFHATDLRLVGGFGDGLQLIHAIQFNLTVFAQFVGTAGMTVLITLWPRFDSPNDRSHLLKKVVGAIGFITVVAGFFGTIFCDVILEHFHVERTNLPIARLYFCIGLLNMVLFAWQISLDGALLSIRKQKITLLNIFILFVCNLLTDLLAVHAYKTGLMTLRSSVFLFIGGTTAWLMVGLFISCVILRKKMSVTMRNTLRYRPFYSVLGNEVLIAMVRSIAPLWFAHQIGGVQSLGIFLVVYQACLHIAYVAALPLQGGLPIAVRDCSEYHSNANTDAKHWLNHIVLLALMPTTIMLLLVMINGEKIIASIFNVALLTEQSAFIPYFFIGCLIGQVGHVVSVPLRARLQNRYITYCLIVSELLMNNIGFMILNHYHLANPLSLGLLTIGYASVFLIIMTLSLLRTNKSRNVMCFENP